MPEARDGDIATYQQCDDPDCPDKREGYEHAHIVRVEHAPAGMSGVGKEPAG